MSISARHFLNGCLKIAQAALPQRCLLCVAPCRDGLCLPCRERLPRLNAARCPVCSLPTADGGTCGACLKQPPHYDDSVAALIYAFPADALVKALKYRDALRAAPVLAQGLLDALPPAPLPDLIVPMPLSAQRLRERGFNQAQEIARIVARRLAVPLAPHLCRRVRDTAPQATLPWQERATNMRGAFACDSDLSGKRIAVVDDVLTSGATLNELAKTLRRRGAVRISGWIVTRTLPG